MKGLIHFVSGVAFASFFPSAVVAAAEAKSAVIALGGVGGILPDTLDFKLIRFLEEFDVQVDPDHENPDPRAIADAIAGAINRAGREGRTIKLMLHTIRMGADAYRMYSVHFNAAQQQVEVTVGPIISMSRIPYLPSALPPDKRSAVAKVDFPLDYTYDRATEVTIFSGPDFRLRPLNGKIEIEFLAWHRSWSHSLTLAAAIGVVGWLGALALERLCGVVLPLPAWMYGLVFGGGASVHVLEDQTGFMGSNLFAPFTRERSAGMKLFHSDHVLANFTTFWLAISCIVFNLNRLTPPAPAWDVPWWGFWLWVFVLPMTIVHGAYHLWAEPRAKVAGTESGTDGGDADDEKRTEAAEEGGGA